MIEKMKDEKNISNLKELIVYFKDLLIKKISKEENYLFLNYSSLETLLCLYLNVDYENSLIVFENEKFLLVQELIKENKNIIEKSNLIFNWESLNKSINLQGTLLSNLAYLKEKTRLENKHIFYIFNDHVFDSLELKYLNEIITLKLPITFIYLEYQDNFCSNKIENSFYYFRRSEIYQNLKNDFKNNLKKFEIGENIYNKTKNIKDIIKSNLIGEKIFKKLKLNYFLVDNNENFNDIKKSIMVLKNHKETNILHIMLHKKEINDKNINEEFKKNKTKNENNNNLKVFKKIYENIENKEKYMFMCDFESIVDDNISKKAFSNIRIVDVFEMIPIIKANENKFNFVLMVDCKNIQEFIVTYNKFFDNNNLNMIILISNNRNNYIVEENFSDLYYLNKCDDITIYHAKDYDDLIEIFNFSTNNKGKYAIRFNNLTINEKKSFNETNKFLKWKSIINDKENYVTILAYGELVNFLEKTITNNNIKANLINCRNISKIDEDFFNKNEIINHKIIIYGIDYKEYSIFNKIVYYNINKNLNIKILSIDKKIKNYKNYKELIDDCNKKFQTILKEE